MNEFLIANMAPIIFASMVLFMLVGFPVAFALAANGVVFGLIGIELGLLGRMYKRRIECLQHDLPVRLAVFYTVELVLHPRGELHVQYLREMLQ